MIVTIAVGARFTTATLIQLGLAARPCPPRVADTVFSLLMSVANFGTASGAAICRLLDGRWLESLGATTAFRLLVVVGASCTASRWLIVPPLRRVLAASIAQNRGEEPN